MPCCQELSGPRGPGGVRTENESRGGRDGLQRERECGAEQPGACPPGTAPCQAQGKVVLRAEDVPQVHATTSRTQRSGTRYGRRLPAGSSSRTAPCTGMLLLAALGQLFWQAGSLNCLPPGRGCPHPCPSTAAPEQPAAPSWPRACSAGTTPPSCPQPSAHLSSLSSPPLGSVLPVWADFQESTFRHIPCVLAKSGPWCFSD